MASFVVSNFVIYCDDWEKKKPKELEYKLSCFQTILSLFPCGGRGGGVLGWNAGPAFHLCYLLSIGI